MYLLNQFSKRGPSIVVVKKYLMVMLFCFGASIARGQNNQNALDHITNVDSLFTQAQLSLTIDGDASEAQKLFQRVLVLQPENAKAHAQLSTIYLHQQNYTNALAEIKEALTYDKGNKEYLNQYAVLLTQTGAYDEAAEIFSSLAKGASDPTEFLLKEAFCYNLAKEYQKALDILSQLKADSGADGEQLLKDKVKLYAHLGKMDSIASIAHQLIKINPEEPDNYVMASVSEDFLKKGAEAVQIIDTALAKFPKEPKVVQQAILMFAKYDHPKLENFYNHLLQSDTYSENEKTILFYPLVDLSKKDTFIRRILYQKLPEMAFKTPPNEPAILFYAALESANKNFGKAASVCKKGIAIDSNNVLFWNGLLQSYLQMEQEDSLKHYNQMALARFPESRIPFYYQSMLKYTSGDTTATINMLEQTKALSEQDSIITDFNIYAFLGDLYESVGKHDSAIVNYKNALAIYPDATMLLNNLSYLLAGQGSNLDSALSMSAKTLAANPEEPMYLDTYGWILFKQKKFEEAKSYLERAIQNMNPPDATIYEHLGDIEEALGNKRKAKKHWQKSMELGNHSLELKNKLGR